MKVQLEFQSGRSAIVDMDPLTQLSDHFTLKDMANNAGDKTKPQYIINSRVDLFLKMHEEFRVWFNRPYTPNCSYRQPEWNRKVGGIASSLHVKGLAVDVPFANMTDLQWNNISAKWESLCKKHGTVGEAGRYTWGFHLGIDVAYQKTFYKFDKR